MRIVQSPLLLTGIYRPDRPVPCPCSMAMQRDTRGNTTGTYVCTHSAPIVPGVPELTDRRHQQLPLLLHLKRFKTYTPLPARTSRVKRSVSPWSVSAALMPGQSGGDLSLAPALKWRDGRESAASRCTRLLRVETGQRPCLDPWVRVSLS